MSDFDKALSYVSNHTKREETLNRLFRKHLDSHKKHIACFAPYLTERNTHVTWEKRPKSDFVKLAQNLHIGAARDSASPIVIIRYKGEECLIDGNHRVRFWHSTDAKGDHTACVVTVLD